MVTYNALRLAAVVVAHDQPSCKVFVTPNGHEALLGACWAHHRVDGWSLQHTWIHATPSAVREYLGY